MCTYKCSRDICDSIYKVKLRKNVFIIIFTYEMRNNLYREVKVTSARVSYNT